MRDGKVYVTLLHYAYYVNEPAAAFVEYLISKGADKNATDTQGLKPVEYSGGVEAVIKHLEYLMQRRLIMTEKFCGEENAHYIQLCDRDIQNGKLFHL